MRILDHCLKIHDHLTLGQTHNGSEANLRVKDALKIGKEEVIRVVRENVGSTLKLQLKMVVIDRFFDFENPLSNSILYARPTALVKAKETRENIEEHYEKY